MLQMDAAHAYTCAANVQRCMTERGPDYVVVGNAYEHRVVDRWTALIEMQVRWVLIYCRADPYRLAALEAHLAGRNEANTDHRGRRPYDTDAVAARLANEALCLVCDAGALTDRRARSRLLAGVEYQLNRQLCRDLGTPELVGSADALIAELDRIDNDPAGEP